MRTRGELDLVPDRLGVSRVSAREGRGAPVKSVALVLEIGDVHLDVHVADPDELVRELDAAQAWKRDPGVVDIHDQPTTSLPVFAEVEEWEGKPRPDPGEGMGTEGEGGVPLGALLGIVLGIFAVWAVVRYVF